MPAAIGQSALAPTIATRLVSRVQSINRQLTQREAEVLTMVAEGKSNQEIGRELFVSEAATKSHMVHIFTKLQVASRTAAVAKARTQGLIR